MTDTKQLMNRITAFRRRLEHTPPLIPETGETVSRMVADPERLSGPPPDD